MVEIEEVDTAEEYGVTTADDVDTAVGVGTGMTDTTVTYERVTVAVPVEEMLKVWELMTMTVVSGQTVVKTSVIIVVVTTIGVTGVGVVLEVDSTLEVVSMLEVDSALDVVSTLGRPGPVVIVGGLDKVAVMLHGQSVIVMLVASVTV